MKPRRVRLALMAIAIATSLTVAGGFTSPTPPTTRPTVRLLYLASGSLLDRACAQITNTTLNTARASETFRRLPEFQGAWDKEGPAYLKVMEDSVGAMFPYSEIQATLTICPSLSSMSMPLIVNALPYLSDVQAAAKVTIPIDHFVETLFHEMMHGYVGPVRASSALLKKYASETPAVLNHLHVAASEKLALTVLNKPAMMTLLDSLYRHGPPDYRRAWEIVNDVENYRAFISELKQIGRTSR